MNKSFLYDKETLHNWQSSICMIPVLLELIKEKFVRMDQNHSDLNLPEINAYETIYHSWEKIKYLNNRQREWVKEIGDYLNAIQQTSFCSQKRLSISEIHPNSCAI